MNHISPPRLKSGDTIRVIAPASSLNIISDEVRQHAIKTLDERFGLHVTFGNHCAEVDEFNSSSVASRVADLHDAFADKNVQGILTVLGGYNSNQLLDHLDYELIKNNPKIFCGFSDITALSNAIYRRTTLVTFSGPHFSTFGCKKGMDYTINYFQKCLMDTTEITVESSRDWSDDAWYLDQENRHFFPNNGMAIVNPGHAEGIIIGGNLCTLNLLHGTSYMPNLKDTILFVEDDYLAFPEIFDRDLQWLIMQPDFDKVKGIAIGRFQNESKLPIEKIARICKQKPELSRIPVIANVDFGHTLPLFTLPIGGTAVVDARGELPSLRLGW